MFSKPSFRKYPIYFICCLLPSVLLFFVNTFVKKVSIPSLIYTPLSWIFSLIFMIGWCVLILKLAVEHPLKTFGGVLIYAGISIVAVSLFYTLAPTAKAMSYETMSFLAGLVSYVPMDCVLRLMLNLAIPHEIVLLSSMILIFLIFWIIGALYGRKVRWRRGY